MFEIVNNYNQNAVIKVIGVGGGGGNAIISMLKSQIHGADFLIANTDVQALRDVDGATTVQIGSEITKGLGAGADPEKGRQAALEASETLKESIEGADMLFIAAGMGGGTGTGSLPVIAKLAKESGALTIAIVTLPFSNEGARRSRNARIGLEKLRKCADTVIVIPNDKLLTEDIAQLPLNLAFRQADEILGNAIKCMTEITSHSGLVNIDFADMRSIMSSGGVAMIGMGEGQGANRASDAVTAALTSPLLELDIEDSKGALVNVTGGDDMTLQEAHEVVREVHSKINKDARIIWGASIDSTLEHQIRVMLVVTGVKSSQILGPPDGVDNGMQSKYGIDFVH